jgi:hypothetical protein
MMRAPHFPSGAISERGFGDCYLFLQKLFGLACFGFLVIIEDDAYENYREDDYHIGYFLKNARNQRGKNQYDYQRAPEMHQKLNYAARLFLQASSLRPKTFKRFSASSEPRPPREEPKRASSSSTGRLRISFTPNGDDAWRIASS